MNAHGMFGNSTTRGWVAGLALLGMVAGPLLGRGEVEAQQGVPVAEELLPVWEWDPDDPRIGLRGGLHDAEHALRHMDLVVNLPRPEGFATNSDLAFQGNYAFMGNYNGFNIFDISDPTNPTIVVSVICPGNQGDLSVFGNLLFKSVQAASGRLDCGSEGVADSVSVERFRGVRIFDITDVANPQQVAAVQTCRGSHTHSLVTSPRDPENVYVYVQGTSSPRPGAELPGCSGLPPEEDPNTSLFQIEVIQVPLAAPEAARIVSEPRVFGDPRTGNIAALRGLTREGTPSSSPIRACHDITSYPDIGLAGGACSGNGLLLDVSNPAGPIRIDEVADANFSYWHSATFNNDGTKLIFTDEWGGGGSPRCRAIDPPNWGGNAIFDIVDRQLRFRSYYKLPVPQTEMENCVAHNGSLIPVPGRDIKVQAWYQGGISVFDFTDAGNPIEIAFFDRGPINEEERQGGGHWSAYWFNGYIYGSEMARGLDILQLVPSQYLSRNEIDAAMLAEMDQFNPQHQPRVTWPTSVVVARAYLDQLARGSHIEPELATRVADELDAAEGAQGGQRAAAAGQLETTADVLESEALAALTRGALGEYSHKRALLAAEMRAIAASMR